ncbi:unnamed protein product, partial [Gongylonema pulchrum]|uniref:Uncharacterized protein n=1 Tax=Gongylonema pulchrum TaxID=637853 RepID=A0A183EYX1_9BILA
MLSVSSWHISNCQDCATVPSSEKKRASLSLTGAFYGDERPACNQNLCEKEERAKSILDSLVNELDNKDVLGHERRCVPHLAECIYHVIDSQTDILMDAINKIMLKTRSLSSK